eukprot:GHRQ01027652.1.p2 GENE.GHRQ01027652.1~~GHRQ01027652.1.p2  ORF type:complete len:153 (+),score=22.46 GHRQ01027652.1:531-989(+)
MHNPCFCLYGSLEPKSNSSQCDFALQDLPVCYSWCCSKRSEVQQQLLGAACGQPALANPVKNISQTVWRCWHEAYLACITTCLHCLARVLQAAGEANKARYRAAYQGVPGAYSEMAACKACPDAEPVPCEQFEVAFQVLRQLAHEVRMLGSA